MSSTLPIWGILISAFELALLLVVRTAVWSFNLLPLKLRLALVTFAMCLLAKYNRSYREVSLRNMELVFPESDQDWRMSLIRDNCRHLAIAIVDALRMNSLDRDWIAKHVDCLGLERSLELKREFPGRGVLWVTGHLGSFELCGHIMPLVGHRLDFVARNFKNQKLDRWWNSKRQEHGNRVIDRTGAFLKILRSLSKGRDVAVLFDQNIRRSQAVFVDWFGRPAATTKSVALSILRQDPLVMFVSLICVDTDRYELILEPIDLSSITDSTDKSDREKVEELTAALATAYSELIRKFPQSWFWMHRRWKTTASEDIPEDFYK